MNYELNKKTIYEYLLEYKVEQKKHDPRKVRLLVDALYFGKRNEDTTWCAIVFRDSLTKENLWWTFTERESEFDYLKGRRELEKLGYEILSVTGDGLALIRKVFKGISFQMCLVHMERIIIRGTTRNPILEAGKVLLALAKSIHTINQNEFNKFMNRYTLKYFHFLNEITYYNDGIDRDYTHRELRKAFLSLQNLHPYLFTYENNLDIPKTTNSIEGHFAHLRDIVNIHRGLNRSLKEKIIHTILLFSTISPNEKQIEEYIKNR